MDITSKFLRLNSQPKLFIQEVNIAVQEVPGLLVRSRYQWIVTLQNIDGGIRLSQWSEKWIVLP